MSKTWKVVDSPVGPGEVTGVSDRGFPQVNGVTVAWLEYGDGEIFDPHCVREKHLADRAEKAKGGAQ